MFKHFLGSSGLLYRILLQEIFDLVLNHGWFCLIDRFFIQTSGLAMGHSHSPPVANLLLFLLLKDPFLRPNWTRFSILQHARYLDDGLFLFDSTIPLVDKFFFELNDIIPGIRFTRSIVHL